VVIIALFLATLTVLLVSIAYGLVSMGRSWREREHRAHVVKPLTAATMNILRSRDVSVSIPAGVAGCSRPLTNAGSIRLPLEWSGSDNDRDALRDMLSERLRTTISCTFDMSGAAPTVKLSIPKQPPAQVSFEEAIERADLINPYLGESVSGAVKWYLGEDSPHIAVLGGSGSGKSELIAWIVAQFMRGGAGVVVLDPKVTSHRWLLNREQVLYCNDRALLHDTIMWLDSELARRAELNRTAADDIEFAQILVLIEERNSMQDLLRDHWYEIKEPGARQKSPALSALDRLNSMGRSLGITVLLAAQESASQHIGSRSNFGSFAIAGRMAANHYKNIGVPRKPVIASTPGRFAYAVAGEKTPFQAAFPDLKQHSERLWQWATSGQEVLNMNEVTQQEGATFPRSEPGSPGSGSPLCTLAEYAVMHPETTIEALKNDRKRYPDIFPTSAGKRGQSDLYAPAALAAWVTRKNT
jgi:hypothetical protein